MFFVSSVGLIVRILIIYTFLIQADVCHAYQILKNGGLKDENIVVFMYDDIANNEENPRKGVIINSPDGDDVYHGVPKVHHVFNLSLKSTSLEYV